MAAAPNVGLLVPSAFPGDLPRPDEFTSFFRAADEMGFHSIWATERVLHRVRVVQPFTMLATAAAATTRIRLGTAVVLASLRHPVALANDVASVDYLSGGRMNFGLSLGGQPAEFEAMGIPMGRRMGRYEETLSLLPRLWSEDSVSHQGRHFQLENVSLAMRPVQAGGIPLLLAGTSDASLRRAGVQSDGWINGGAGSPDEMRQRCETIVGYAAEAGRDWNGRPLGKIIYTSIDDNRERSRERLFPTLTGYYGPQYDVDNLCAMGTPQECAAYINTYVEVGVNLVLVGFPSPDVAQLERLKSEVLPLLG